MTNEELSLRTKKALAAALKKAMEHKNLSKITVSELITECNVNRKTFYYHFKDIYALLKWMFEQETFEVIKNFDMITNTEESFRFIMDYIEENKHIINCTYDSLAHEKLKRFFYKDFYGLIRKVIEESEEKLNISVDDSFKDFVSIFYSEAVTGMLINWTKNRIGQDRETAIQNMLLICRVSIPALMKARSQEKNS